MTAGKIQKALTLVFVVCGIGLYVMYHNVNTGFKHVPVETVTNTTPNTQSVPPKRNQIIPTKDESPVAKVITECPRTPPNLVGDFQYNKFSGNMSELDIRYLPYKPGPGGKFKPTTCKARQKVAIIIAYRDRWRNLMDFLSNVPPMLIRQQLEFTIYVIEQDSPEIFNRGLLMNIGYLEALKIDNYNCFIFHDVDMYPVHDFNLYRCDSKPRHMAVAVEKAGYGLLFESYFGGVTAFRKAHYNMTNGFSNAYFGWGGEDGDQRERVYKVFGKFFRYPVVYGRYATPHHKEDKTNPGNPNRFTLLQNAVKRMPYDGLNSIEYKVNKIKMLNIYTHIHISADRQKIEQNIDDKKKEIEEMKKRNEKLKTKPTPK